METPPQPSTTNNNGTEAGTGGAYGPSDLSGTYQPLGERQFIDMFTTSHARSNGHAVSTLWRDNILYSTGLCFG